MSLMPMPQGSSFDFDREALLEQLRPEQGAALDTWGRRAADLAPRVAKAFGKNIRPGMGTAIGIGGEILGGLLKPKAQEAKVGAFGDYLSQHARRREGSGDGVLGGAAKWGGRGAQIGSVIPGLGTAIGGGIGAAAGAIGNLFTKNAASAYTDFSADGARQAIRDIYRAEGGREVGEDELNTILAGQGLKAGDRWVGEKGMLSVLENLRNNFAMERKALTSQIGA
jgi:hypothetical protein